MLELDVALVGDHRAELRLDLDSRQLDLQKLGVLEPQGFAALGLLELRKRLLDGHLTLLCLGSIAPGGQHTIHRPWS